VILNNSRENHFRMGIDGEARIENTVCINSIVAELQHFYGVVPRRDARDPGGSETQGRTSFLPEAVTIRGTTWGATNQ
jgi:hypothetical protein